MFIISYRHNLPVRAVVLQRAFLSNFGVFNLAYHVTYPRKGSRKLTLKVLIHLTD